MPEQLLFTHLLNRLFAAPVDALLRGFHIEPAYPRAPIPNSVAMEVLVVAFLLLFFVLVRARLSVERPGALQHLVEGSEAFITNQSREIIGGHEYHAFTGFLTALGLFILMCNLIGLILGFESPTAVPDPRRRLSTKLAQFRDRPAPGGRPTRLRRTRFAAAFRRTRPKSWGQTPAWECRENVPHFAQTAARGLPATSSRSTTVTSCDR